MRKLVAAYACRVQGTRLYGKPLQNLDIENGVTILDHIVELTRSISSIDDIVLGVSEGKMNEPFWDLAKNHKIMAVQGSEKNVLMRLIQCGLKGQATDVFRVTTECPYFMYDMVDQAWKAHILNKNDVTVVDGLPEGAFFEIFRLDALEKSHDLGEERHRSEFCSLYTRENRKDFKIEVIPIPSKLQRMDLRLTVDYPEDLILCRKIYEKFKNIAPFIPVHKIIDFLDSEPEIKNLVDPFIVPERLW